MLRKIKTISGTKLRQNFADITQVVANDTAVIITYRGVQKQVIMSLDRYEDLLASSNPKYLADIKQARLQAKSGQYLKFDEAFDNL